MNKSFLGYLVLTAFTTIISACNTTVSDNNHHDITITDQKMIFANTQHLAKTHSCEDAVKYLVDLTLNNSSVAAQYLDQVLNSPLGHKVTYDGQLPHPIPNHVLRKFSPNDYKNGQENNYQDYKIAQIIFRSYASYVADTNASGIRTYASLWPSIDVKYDECAHIENAISCSDYAREKKLVLDRNQAVRLWAEMKNHPSAKCQKRRIIPKY